MPRDTSEIKRLGEPKPTKKPGDVLPSEDTLFEAKLIFIFCEGKTEYYYFNGFRDEIRSSRVKVIPRFPDQGRREGSDIESLTSQVLGSIDRKKVVVSNDEYDIDKIDEFKILFDRDQNFQTNKNGVSKYSKAIRKIDGKKIDVFLSNYSFEVWILCHFNKPSRPGKFTSLKRQIEKESGWARYSKKDREIYMKLKTRIDLAIDNSLELISEKDEKNIPIHSEESNPVTEVGKLVQYIRSQLMDR